LLKVNIIKTNIAINRWKIDSTYSIVLSNCLDLFVVVRSGESCQAVRVQFPHLGVQFRPVVFSQLSAERVDRDDNGTSVSLKLQNNNKTYILDTGLNI